MNADDFELFARDFLKSLGFTIVADPARGADGGMDLIVASNLYGKQLRWLVSCKHFAKSQEGRSVNPADEPDIGDRLKTHNCHGFIGFYSTIPSVGLQKKLNALDFGIWFDFRKIEQEILESKMDIIVKKYFPRSYEEYKSSFNTEQNIEVPTDNRPPKDVNISDNNGDNHIDAALVALAVFEIQRISDEYFDGDWTKRDMALDKLFRFYKYPHWRVRNEIISFLDIAAAQMSPGMPNIIATSIATVIEFYITEPIINSNKDLDRDIIKRTLRVAYKLIRAGFLKLNDLFVAEDGFLILKYIYIYAAADSASRNEVLVVYDVIENWLKNSKRDFSKEKNFLKAFKDDLNKPGLETPSAAMDEML